ncbi:MAG: TSUP family transporter [Proteobacteria bacterium]|nr:TSUP family transporter [Pseudomonadota bacterium]
MILPTLSAFKIAAALICSAWITSLISAVFGMAGGLILMGILNSILTVSLAMIAHGVIQCVANGTRAILIRQSIVWGPLTTYCVGFLIGVLVSFAVSFQPDKSLVGISLGCVAFLPRLMDRLKLALNFAKPSHSLTCGILMSVSQLTAGAAGPVLDAFFAQTSMSKYQIVATKAASQTISHLAKVCYFWIAIGFKGESSSPLELTFLLTLLLACLASIVGTHHGKALLDRFSESAFRKWYRVILEVVGSLILISSIVELLVSKS